MKIFESIVMGAAAVFGIVVLVCAIGLLLAWPTMLLWNGCLVPAVTFANDVTLFQTWGLMILFGLLGVGRTASSSTKSS